MRAPEGIEEAAGPAPAAEQSFADVLNQFEADHAACGEEAGLTGTVLSVTDEALVLDIGRKIEGVLRREGSGLSPDVALGTVLTVNVVGRTEDGYYSLSAIRVARPVDLTGLKSALESKAVIAGRVTASVKGGLRVDVGVPAFLPASRSGVRVVADLEKLIGQDIQVRITKLDDSDPERPDVVVDRRSVLEEQSAMAKREALDRLSEGMDVQVKVRSLTEFGAFCEIVPGIDGLLHVVDMSWQRVAKPDDVVQPGQVVTARILKVNREARKISLGLKQLEPDPWTLAAGQFKPGDRVRGKVVRLTDFGAFVELAAGVDGLIHLSEMSWTRRIKKPSDVLKVGDDVETLVLEVKAGERRIGLGLKQALGNPWDDIEQKYPEGTVVEAPVKSLAQFGAFVDLGDGIDGMIHVGDLSREKRVNHPGELLQVGQVVKAQVLEVDKGKKRIRLGMKQLEPTAADLWVGEHKVGDEVSGRVVEVRKDDAKVELAEGVHARCRFPKPAAPETSSKAAASIDDLAAVLTAKWRAGAGPSTEGGPPVKTGQIRRLRITSLDEQSKRIDVDLID